MSNTAVRNGSAEEPSPKDGKTAAFVQLLRRALEHREIVRRRMSVIRDQCGRGKLTEAFLNDLETIVTRAGIHTDRPLTGRSTLLSQSVRFSLEPFAPAEVRFGCERQLVDLVEGVVGKVAPLDELEVRKREFQLRSGRRVDLLCREIRRGGGGDLVAVEFKRGEARGQAVIQLKDYLEELRTHSLARQRTVRGILLAKRIAADVHYLPLEVFGIECFEYSFAFTRIERRPSS